MSENQPENNLTLMSNETVDIESEDNTSVGVGDYDMDSLINEIEKVDDLNVLDDLYNKLQTEFLHKTQLLTNIRQQNAEMKCELNSSKYFLSELEQLQNDGQVKTKNLRDIIEAKQGELQKIHTQQIEDLVLFENNVQKITEKFKNAPKEYESNSLMEKVVEVQTELDHKIAEITKYKQDLQAVEDKFKEPPQVDQNCQSLSLKVFENSIKDIDTLNEKLSNSLEQLSNQVNNGLRYEISNLNIHEDHKI
ncbi:uncharacterized protein LOC124359644 isoform X1 [Homalodisca vitripennis]|uniref:uncharacterized protein LOC124359644 isoform X1 n=2 Tax=Homalodisca vitripennis TaxID=197043 RepID=UPI001EEC6055|nr:uncharacterized protein LOC124359644 isoform X1 [Homalodisca vitripennis]